MEHYIILNNGILISNSSVFPWSEGYILQYTPKEIDGQIVELLNDIMSVLGLNSGYTVKYNPLSSGVPLGFALGHSFRQMVIFDSISLVLS